VYGFEVFTLEHRQHAVDRLVEVALLIDKGMVLAESLVADLRAPLAFNPELGARSIECVCGTKLVGSSWDSWWQNECVRPWVEDSEIENLPLFGISCAEGNSTLCLLRPQKRHAFTVLGNPVVTTSQFSRLKRGKLHLDRHFCSDCRTPKKPERTG
jgi:hypothetical protein